MTSIATPKMEEANASADRFFMPFKTHGSLSITSGGLTKDEQIIHNKIAYEWKGIFRDLTLGNLDLTATKSDNDWVSINAFDKVCMKHRVGFSKEELKKIVKFFGKARHENETISHHSVNLAENPKIDFVTFSKRLGLHKESYNYLNSNMRAQRARSLLKLRNLY
jgi:hypothetical protein